MSVGIAAAGGLVAEEQVGVEVAAGELGDWEELEP